MIQIYEVYLKKNNSFCSKNCFVFSHSLLLFIII